MTQELLKARRAYKAADGKGQEMLEGIFGKDALGADLREILKTVDDVLAYNGISRADFDKEYEGRPLVDKARKVGDLIVETFNEGGKADYRDNKQPKYVNWFIFGAAGFGFDDTFTDAPDTLTYSGVRRTFLNYDHAQYAGSTFLAVWEAEYSYNEDIIF